MAPGLESSGTRELSTSLDEEADETIAIKKVNIGTRRSALALVQAQLIQNLLRKAHPKIEFEIHAMATMGDKNQVIALNEFGAKSLWTYELENKLLEGKLDIIVHCLKDMPTKLPDKCAIGCIMEREDPRDVVVMKKGLDYASLCELPDGAVVGTSSLRRSAQIKKNYPHLKLKDVRGNIGTRLDKLDARDGEYSCLVLAAAGIKRMGWDERITQYLDTKTGRDHHYAVGQGALAIEIREDDEKIIKILSGFGDKKSTLATMSERSLMRTLEGGCSVPIGVESTWIEPGKLLLKAIVINSDSTISIQAERLGELHHLDEADDLGRKVAYDLIEKGATRILQEFRLSRSVGNVNNKT